MRWHYEFSSQILWGLIPILWELIQILCEFIPDIMRSHPRYYEYSSQKININKKIKNNKTLKIENIKESDYMKMIYNLYTCYKLSSKL